MLLSNWKQNGKIKVTTSSKHFEKENNLILCFWHSLAHTIFQSIMGEGGGGVGGLVVTAASQAGGPGFDSYSQPRFIPWKRIFTPISLSFG